MYRKPISSDQFTYFTYSVWLKVRWELIRCLVCQTRKICTDALNFVFHINVYYLATLIKMIGDSSSFWWSRIIFSTKLFWQNVRAERINYSIQYHSSGDELIKQRQSILHEIVCLWTPGIIIECSYTEVRSKISLTYDGSVIFPWNNFTQSGALRITFALSGSEWKSSANS